MLITTVYPAKPIKAFHILHAIVLTSSNNCTIVSIFQINLVTVFITKQYLLLSVHTRIQCLLPITPSLPTICTFTIRTD